VTLGATHLGQLIDEFGGSYVLAIAAYNAGGGRAREWIADWGDPRARGADVVDWIELIPITETRNYVQRVLENLQVYRHRLAGAPTPIGIEQDLRRGAF
jgi:soluble lytic murein transglycosylase